MRILSLENLSQLDFEMTTFVEDEETYGDDDGDGTSDSLQGGGVGGNGHPQRRRTDASDHVTGAEVSLSSENRAYVQPNLHTMNRMIERLQCTAIPTPAANGHRETPAIKAAIKTIARRRRRRQRRQCWHRG